MTPKEIINVLQAFEEGKEIEYREKNSKIPWKVASTPCWNFHNYNYQVKQKEKELYQYLIYDKPSNIYHTTSRFYENAFDLQSNLSNNWEIIQRLNHTKVIIKEE